MAKGNYMEYVFECEVCSAGTICVVAFRAREDAKLLRPIDGPYKPNCLGIKNTRGNSRFKLKRKVVLDGEE